MTKISDDTVMWFGVHKGKKLKEIPNDYFTFLLQKGISFKDIKHYTKSIRKIS
jgi:uncharacterized protein (DUF3820 family)